MADRIGPGGPLDALRKALDGTTVGTEIDAGPAIAAAALGALHRALDEWLKADSNAQGAALRDRLADLARAVDVQQVNPDLEATRQLAVRAAQLGLQPPRPMTEATATPSLLASNTGLTLDFDPLLFGIGMDVSTGRPRLSRTIWDVVTNAIVFVLVGVVGILALWAPALGWGSPLDIATALLAGIGTRLALGARPRGAAG